MKKLTIFIFLFVLIFTCYATKDESENGGNTSTNKNVPEHKGINFIGDSIPLPTAYDSSNFKLEIGERFIKNDGDNLPTKENNSDMMDLRLYFQDSIKYLFYVENDTIDYYFTESKAFTCGDSISVGSKILDAIPYSTGIIHKFGKENFYLELNCSWRAGFICNDSILGEANDSSKLVVTHFWKAK
jgi:hypothetical protein